MADVEAIRELKRRRLDLPSIAAMAAQALYANRTLERSVRRLLDVLGADMPIMLLDEDSARILLSRTKAMLKSMCTPTASDVLRWSRTFYALGEEHMAQIELYTGEKEPWRPFLELAEKLCGDVAEITTVNTQLEVAYGYLMMARRNVRNVAYHYVRAHEGRSMAAKTFPHVTGDVHEEVLALMFPS